MSELTNTNPSTSTGGRAPNDPCASNDAENFALNAGMFSRSQETGEWELTGPCTTTTEATTTIATSSSTTTTAEPTGQPTPAPTTAAPTTAAPSTEAPVVTGSPIALDSDGTVAGTDATEAAASTGATAVSTVVSTTVAAETTAGTQAATAASEATDASAKPEEGTEFKSFYSCSSSGDPSNGNNGENGVGAAPPNSKEVTLTYDYELHTSSPFEESMLSSFENAIAHDLASQFGLVNCGNSGGGRLRRRNLRVLRGEEVLALGSEPVDDSLAGTYECEVEVNLGDSSSCTPIRGYMTAWIPESSNLEEAEAQLLALIENGMTNDLYTSDEVLKASYVGVREDGSDKGQGGDGGGSDGIDGNANPSAGNGDGSTDGSNGSTDPSNGGSTNDGNANPSTGGPNIDGAQGTDTDPGQEEANGPPLVAIGIALFFLAFAMAAGLFVYMRRRRRRQFFSDGPDDMGNGQSLAAQAALSDGEAPHDPDDVQLLPSPDKLDMRSVYSEEASTDCETENYTYEDYRNKEKEMTSRYGTLYGGSYGDGGAAVINTLSSTTMDYGEDKDGDTPKMANGMVGAGSSLAAMGVASTLAARSFSPPPVSDDAPASPDSAGYDVPPSPMDPMEDDDSEADYGAQATPGADSDDSHVGTVEAVTPGAGLADGSSVGFPDVSPGVEEKVEEGTPSMDSMEEGTFGTNGPMAWA